MAVETVRVTLESLKFPNFGDDDSKKNFRILATFECVDKDLKPTKFLTSLPPLDQDNWQWRKSGKTNFISHDGNGTLNIGEREISERTFLREQTDIRLVSFTIVDVEDKNPLDFAAPILKEAAKLGLGAIPGTGLFGKVIDSAKAEAGSELDKLIDKLVKEGNKRLFRKDLRNDDDSTVKSGSYTVSGKGVLKKKTDKLGDYSFTIKVTKTTA